MDIVASRSINHFTSPESFTFIESAIIVAIVVLGGMGSQTGVVLASIFLIGITEIFRDLEQYRMIAFGGAMVLIMVFKPKGILANRKKKTFTSFSSITFWLTKHQSGYKSTILHVHI